MSAYYSSQGELQRRLKAFSNLHLADTSYSKILNILNNEFLLPITVTQIHAGQYIERIRINNGTEIFYAKEDISYIKDAKQIKTYGRANAPGHAMFYGSVVSSGVSLPRISALAETVVELQGENKGLSNKKLLMTVGKWKIKKDLILSELVFKKDAIDKCADVRAAYATQYRSLSEHHNEFQLKQLVAILEFYSEQFAKRSTNHNDYKISAAFTEFVCKLPNLQGVIYPSVQTEFEGMNVALTPEAVESCLELEEAVIVSADIRNTKVFLNNHFRTGLLKPDQTSLEWGKAESVGQEVVEQYFLGNNTALEEWNNHRMIAKDYDLKGNT